MWRYAVLGRLFGSFYGDQRSALCKGHPTCATRGGITFCRPNHLADALARKVKFLADCFEQGTPCSTSAYLLVSLDIAASGAGAGFSKMRGS
jgi:hypothetical protein